MARHLDRSHRQTWIIDAVRTPIGRYGGALGTVRPDDLAALVIRAIVDRSGIDPAVVEDVILGCANQAGRGQPQRRPHGGAARRAPGGGRGPDRQPAVRVRPPGGQHGEPRDRRRRRRRVHRRGRRVHDAGAVRDAQGGGGVRPRPADDGGHDARLAVREPPDAGGLPADLAGRDRRVRRGPVRRRRASARTRLRSRASGGRARRSRRGGSRRSWSRSPCRVARVP